VLLTPLSLLLRRRQVIFNEDNLSDIAAEMDGPGARRIAQFFPSFCRTRAVTRGF
jgi:hypothetical protein